MDDGGHRENGRHRPDLYRAPQSQWLMQQPQSMKHIMSIMAERDAAIQERNMAVSEKKKALEERDLAIMQRDAAIQERDNAVMERENAIAALQARQIPMNNIGSCPPGCQISRGVKHMHHPHQQHFQHTSHMGEASCDDSRDVQVHDALPLTSVSSDSPKPRKVKRAKETSQTSPNKKPSKSKHKVKKGEDLNKMMFHKSPEWKDIHDMDDSDDYNEQLGDSKSCWKGSDLGLNLVSFDESTMAPPVCSCTGVYRQCYKWGNGGWQSACCTTTLSMYPLPSVPNKRHARVGGRKMSGSAFNKLLSRLATDGHDLSNPIDLKDHWAKHGTNRYITIR